MLKQKIVDFCKSIGLECIGFIPCRVFEELRPFYEERQRLGLQNEFEESEIEKRINPAHYMPEAKTILSIAFPYEHDKVQDSNNGLSTYTQRADYHRVVKKYLELISSYIEELGGKAMGFVDSNTLPERYIAYLAGVGFIGKNNMLITEKYGSYVFLGELLIDLEIKCEEQNSLTTLKAHRQCGACHLCITECPTKSINSLRCNPNICLSYITQKKDITIKEIKLLKGNIFGCDFCQLKCPYNQQAIKNVLEEFKTLPHMLERAEVYAGMDNKYFKEKISGTSCGWRGKNVIRRNAIIHLNQLGEDISCYSGDSPYINEYINKLTMKKEIENKS